MKTKMASLSRMNSEITFPELGTEWELIIISLHQLHRSVSNYLINSLSLIVIIRQIFGRVKVFERELLLSARGDCKWPCFDQLHAHILESQQNSKRSKMCAFS